MPSQKIDANERLILALDLELDDSKKLVKDLDGVVNFFKVGLSLQLAEGIDSFISELLDQKKRVDLMFTDIGLPGLNGRELAATVQRRHPKVRTLFTSGYAQMPSSTGSRSVNDIPLLSKPFTRAQLYERVCQVLDA